MRDSKRVGGLVSGLMAEYTCRGQFRMTMFGKDTARLLVDTNSHIGHIWFIQSQQFEKPIEVISHSRGRTSTMSRNNAGRRRSNRNEMTTRRLLTRLLYEKQGKKKEEVVVIAFLRSSSKHFQFASITNRQETQGASH